MRRKQVQKCLRCLFPVQCRLSDVSVLSLFLAQAVLGLGRTHYLSSCTGFAAFFLLTYFFISKQQVAAVHCMQFLESGSGEVF